MKIVNSNIKNALKNPTTQRKGRILINDKYYDVYNVEYYADTYDNGNVIGNAIASQIDFDIPYISKFDSFKYFDGVWTDFGYEYVDMGTFTVFDEKDEDEFTKHITAFDNLIKFNAPFQNKGTYPKTLFEELQNVCEQAGIELQNTTIPNGNFIVENNQFVNEESIKTVVKNICGASGTYAIIKNDKLVLQLKNETTETINKSQHEPVTWKRKTYGINQVVMGMSNVEGEYVIRQDEEDIALNGVHRLVINDNMFAYTQAKREQLIDELFEQVRGFGYIPYELKGEWLNYLEIGDTINLDGVDTIVLRINGKSPKALESEMSAPAIIDSAIDYVDNTDTIENKMKKTEIIVDKQNQIIQSFASQVIQLSETKSSVGSVTLENAHAGELHRLSIKGNISLLYPSSQNGLYGYALAPRIGLTPSATLTPSISITNNNEIKYPNSNLFGKNSILIIDDVEYKLDFNFLNYINNVDCDEFVYEDGKCWIIRRVGIDENGELYKTESETIEYKKDILLKIKNDSVIKLKSFDNVVLEVTYLLDNEYTDYFSTSAEVKSEIKQTADEINLEVSQKVGENEVISAINLTTEQASIKSSKIALEGYTTINNGFSVDEQGNATMNNANINGGNLEIINNSVTSSSNPKFKIYDQTKQYPAILYNNALKLNNSDGGSSELGSYNGGVSNLILRNNPEYFAVYTSSAQTGYMEYYNSGARFYVNINPSDPYIQITNKYSSNFSSMTPNGVWSPSFNNNSLESKKKNIQKDDGCLQQILNSDICSFNWKYEDDDDQKHIGLIIADENGNYKIAPKVLTHDKDAVDLYSMSGMSWKAIQELYDIIKMQEQKIKELEERLNGITKGY